MIFFEDKNNNIFETIFESVSEGIVVVNIDQKIAATNTQANDMFGYAKASREVVQI